MKTVLMINPKFVVRHPPLGLGYLASYVAKYYPGRYRFTLVDYSFQDDRDLLRRIEEDEPDLVAVTSTTNTFTDAVRIAALVRESRSTPIVIGGVHITSTPSDLAGTPFDVAVLGEGEETFLELLMRFDQSGRLADDSIAGIAFLRENRLVRTAARPLIADLDSIPMPDYSLFAMKEYYTRPKALAHGFYAKGTSMMPSRGCPYSDCSFCASDILWRNKIRRFSPQRVFSEIEFLVNSYGLNSIIFLDDNFTTSVTWLKELAALIKGSPFYRHFKFDCESIAEFVDGRKLELLQEMGCERIEFGFESGCRRVLEALKNRRASVAKNSLAVRMCNERGMKLLGNFIFGWFDEREEEVRETVDFINRHRIDYVAWHTLAPYPGTRTWEELQRLLRERGAQVAQRDLYRVDTGSGIFPLNPHLEPARAQELYADAARRAALSATYIFHDQGLTGAEKEELMQNFVSDMSRLNVPDPKVARTAPNRCDSTMTLAALCSSLEHRLPVTTRRLMEDFDLLSGHPWSQHASSDQTTYYACLHALAKSVRPSKILEVGTAFGMSGAALVSACRPLQRFVSIDLGFFHREYNFPECNISFSARKIRQWCERNHVAPERALFFQANTQPLGKSDNDNKIHGVPHWSELPELAAQLRTEDFDVIFIDGKHTEDGLYNDMSSFWQFLRPGGLLLCDDLHEPEPYRSIYPWAGDTLDSFRRFLAEHQQEVEEWHIWNFPRVLPPTFEGVRPFGIIRKKTGQAAPAEDEEKEIRGYFSRMLESVSAAERRLYYRDQSPDSLMALVAAVRKQRPREVIELGTLSGMSLRAWLKADPSLRVTTVDLSFDSLHKSREVADLDLTRVRLLQQDIMELRFAALVTEGSPAILYVDAHDGDHAPIMEHVLRDALPVLPPGSLVMVDDLWYSPDTLDERSAARFFDSYLLERIDPLQCFKGYYAPYWKGGSFMGFKEVVPLLEWVNSRKVELEFDPGGKSVSFTWRGER